MCMSCMNKIKITTKVNNEAGGKREREKREKRKNE